MQSIFYERAEIFEKRYTELQQNAFLLKNAFIALLLNVMLLFFRELRQTASEQFLLNVLHITPEHFR